MHYSKFRYCFSRSSILQPIFLQRISSLPTFAGQAASQLARTARPKEIIYEDSSRQYLKARARLYIMTEHPYPDQREDRDENLTFTLPSGRNLGYARYGAANTNFPTTIYIHGYPASRLEPATHSKALLSSGLQLIAIDRPGFGLSSPMNKPFSDRTILDHASDIEALADHLHLKRFAVMGISGGAPYAVACAHAFPSRLVGVGIVAGFGPYHIQRSKEVWSNLHWLNKLGLIVPVKFPWLYEKLYGWLVPWFVRKMCSESYSQVVNTTSFKKYVADTAEGKLLLSEDGEEVYNNSMRTVQAAIQQEGFAKAHVEETRLLAKDWPFEIGEIRHGNVRLWFGTKDVNTPVQGGEMFAEALGGQGRVHFTRIEGGTHASVVYDGAKWIKELLGPTKLVDIDEHAVRP